MRVADGWKTDLLGTVANVIDPHPSHRAPVESKEGIPFPGIGDFREDGSLDFSSCRMVDASVFDDHHNRYEVIDGTIGFGRVASIGKVIRLRPDLLPYAVSPTMAIIMPQKIDAGYLAHFLKGPQLTEQLASLLTGTTRSSLGIELLRKLKVTFPEDPKEQEQVGEVLSTLDRAIEETEAVIAKQQRIKAGLMQDLLTKGIDEHGVIRSEATHQFKDSPLGRIPAEWDCAPLFHFVPSAEYGISTSLGDSGIPVLRMNNFMQGEADVTDLKYSNLAIPEHLFLKDGDVLFNRTNSWEHVGRTGIWRSQLDKTTFASYLVRLNPNPDLLVPELLNIWLNWEPIQIAMRRQATPAVQQVNINPTNLRAIHAAFPQSIDEQNEIVKRLTGMRHAIGSTQASLNKLRQMKTALMHDLLTGTVRVN